MRIFSDSPLPSVLEILFTWVAIGHFWQFIFFQLNFDFLNFDYLQWSCTAFSVLYVGKYLAKCGNVKFEKLVGARVSMRDTPEIIFWLIMSVVLGYGCWSVLVCISANINIAWACSHWNLVDAKDFFEIQWSKQWVFIYLLTSSVVVPITEEIVFRGFVLRRLMMKHSAMKATIISALIFSIFHLDKSFLGSMLHGVIFAQLAIRFSSLYYPIIVHGLYNASMLFAKVVFGGAMVVNKAEIENLSYWTIEGAALIVGVSASAFVLYRVRNKPRANEETVKNFLDYPAHTN